MKSEFFTTLNTFLESCIEPISNKLDDDPQLLQQAYQQLIEIGALRLLIPMHLGGLGGERSEWVNYNLTMAKYSGVLLFLQAQHQYSVSKLKQLLPGEAIEACLATIAHKNEGNGICLAADKKILLGHPDQDGFRVNGELFWVTGFQFFKEIFVSFDYDNSHYFIKIPFQSIKQNEGTIAVSDLITTTIFNSANTVKLTINNWYITKSEIIAVLLKDKDKHLEHPSAFNFAGAASALLALAKKGKYANHPQAEKFYTKMSIQLKRYCDDLASVTKFPCERRAQGRMLAEQCAMYARTTCGVTSLIASHPINRICKEIWHYTVAGYSDEQIVAYIDNSKNSS